LTTQQKKKEGKGAKKKIQYYLTQTPGKDRSGRGGFTVGTRALEMKSHSLSASAKWAQENWKRGGRLNQGQGNYGFCTLWRENESQN